jgi:hypothetical protein
LAWGGDFDPDFRWDADGGAVEFGGLALPSGNDRGESGGLTLRSRRTAPRPPILGV